MHLGKLIADLDGANHCQFSELDVPGGGGCTDKCGSMSSAVQQQVTLSLLDGFLEAMLNRSQWNHAVCLTR